MALWILHTDDTGHVTRVVEAPKGADFFRAMRAIPHVPLPDADVAWGAHGPWESPHLTAADWRALGVAGLDRSVSVEVPRA